MLYITLRPRETPKIPTAAMQISISIEELTQLQNSISHKDVEIAMLRKEVEQLRKQPVIQGGTENDAFIIPLRLENVCKVFRLLKGNSALSSSLFLALLKMVPEGVSEGMMKCIVDAASLESFPMSITAQGDVHVDGNFNDIHNNDNVAV